MINSTTKKTEQQINTQKKTNTPVSKKYKQYMNVKQKSTKQKKPTKYTICKKKIRLLAKKSNTPVEKQATITQNEKNPKHKVLHPESVNHAC